MPSLQRGELKLEDNESAEKMLEYFAGIYQLIDKVTEGNIGNTNALSMKGLQDLIGG